MWNSKIERRYSRLKKKVRLTGLWRWRRIALGLHLARLSIQTGTIPCERTWSHFQSLLPSATKKVGIETFRLLSSLTFLRMHAVHFLKDGCANWLRQDVLLLQRVSDLERAAGVPNICSELVAAQLSMKLATKSIHRTNIQTQVKPGQDLSKYPAYPLRSVSALFVPYVMLYSLRLTGAHCLLSSCQAETYQGTSTSTRVQSQPVIFIDQQYVWAGPIQCSVVLRAAATGFNAESADCHRKDADDVDDSCKRRTIKSPDTHIATKYLC